MAKAVHSPLRETIFWNLIVAAAYCLTGLWGLELAFVNSNVTLLWPPTGIAMAALLRRGLSLAPGILLGALLTNLMNGAPPVIAASIAGGNAGGMILGYGLMSAAYRDRPDLGKARFIVYFVIYACILGSLGTALWGSLTLLVGGVIASKAFLETGMVWWVGDAMGVLLLTPILLTDNRSFRVIRGPRRIAELFGLLLLTFTVSYIIFYGDLGFASNYPFIYLSFPLLVWGVLRFGPSGGAIILLIVASFATGSTASGLGPFSMRDVHSSLLFLHSYLSLFGITTLLLGAIFAEKREYLEQISEERTKAEESNRLKSQFLANMSHEIRTPVASILGFVELLEKEDTSRDEKQYFARVIRKNGEHLISLIGDILDLSRIEAGRLVLKKQDVNPLEFLEEVSEVFRMRAEEKGLSFWMRTEGDLPIKLALDTLRVRQILSNLLGNAIKFTRKGSVGLNLRGRHSGTDLELKFSVVDTGMGIPSEQLVLLFRPFSQLDTSPTREHGGVGLGLAISYRLAQLLRGSLTVESTPGAGSAFHLTLPVMAADCDWYGRSEGQPSHATSDSSSMPSAATQDSSSALSATTNGQAQENESKSSAKTTSPVGRGLASPRNRKLRPRNSDGGSGELTVLVAEDTPDIQELLRRQLEGAGVKVSFAWNGKEAVSMVQERERQGPGESFDFVLMDIQMPVMDGYEAVSLLRSGGYSGRILALTAHAMEGEEQKCLAAGMDGYLSKPVKRKDLLEALGLSTGEKGSISGLRPVRAHFPDFPRLSFGCGKLPLASAIPWLPRLLRKKCWKTRQYSRYSSTPGGNDEERRSGL
ncbi:MAG: MASE1 domain-containing protein [Leptospiraceae bacterium]|nr:MASE1 domain-containing protein [Leptospiraceae bacterium]